MTETPCVIVDVQRAGPSTGQATKGAQGDLMQSRWGTHGDVESIVLAPNSAQETFELTLRAFHLSEKLRHPVIVLSDEIVGHSREKVVVKTKEDLAVQRKYAMAGKPPFDGVNDDGWIKMPRFGDGHNLLVTGSTHDEYGYRKTSDPDVHDKLVRRISAKIQNEHTNLTDVVVSGQESAEWGIISYGCTSRSVEELVARSSGAPPLKSLRLRTIWPFPDSEIMEFAESVDRLLVPELSLGQLSREVSRVVSGSVDVVPLTKIGGGLMIEPDELVERIGFDS
jgi:2-oxoglutarate ferredoxin oxidoreductase subunit alpha